MPPLWDYCMWSVCSDLYSMDMKMRNIFGTARQCERPCLFVCSQIVAPLLNYEKQQPGATLNFHKTITAFLIQVAHPFLHQTRWEMERQTEGLEEKKRVTDKQSTNKQKVRHSDGATVLRLLLRWYQLLLLPKCFDVLSSKITCTNESAAYSSKTVFRP